MANRFVASALHHHEIADVDVAGAEQARSVRMDVVGARHFRCPAPFLAAQAPANRQRQVHDLAGEQAVFRRRFEFGLHSVFSLDQLRRSYQYMSDRTMYRSTPGSGYHVVLPTWEGVSTRVPLSLRELERNWKETDLREGTYSTKMMSAPPFLCK